jgi:HSP20 family molecular chaperone IbpA
MSNCVSANGESSKEHAEPQKEGGKEMIWKLKERHVGPFERSFTFPSAFKKESMELKVEAGVLSIKLLKDHEADKEAKNRLVIESEI